MVILYHPNISILNLEDIIINIANSKKMNVLARLKAEYVFEKAAAEILCKKMISVNNNTNYIGDNKYIFENRVIEYITLKHHWENLKKNDKVCLCQSLDHMQYLNDNDYLELNNDNHVESLIDAIYSASKKNYSLDYLFNNNYRKNISNDDGKIKLNNPISLVYTFYKQNIIENFIPSLNSMVCEENIFKYKCLLIDLSNEDIFRNVTSEYCKKLVIVPVFGTEKKILQKEVSIQSVLNMDEINSSITNTIKELMF